MVTASLIKKLKQHNGPLSPHLGAFASRLSREGHSYPSTWCNVSVVSDFNYWLARAGLLTRLTDRTQLRSGHSPQTHVCQGSATSERSPQHTPPMAGCPPTAASLLVHVFPTQFYDVPLRLPPRRGRSARAESICWTFRTSPFPTARAPTIAFRWGLRPAAC